MSSNEPAEGAHEAIEAQLDDYVDGNLSEEDRRALEEHLETCEACQASLEELREAVRALSGLHRMSKPQDFEQKVERTIERRSAGRFFGRKAFGDRVPFELLAIIALLLAVGIFLLYRYSGTGTLNLDGDTEKPKIEEGAKEVVPKP